MKPSRPSFRHRLLAQRHPVELQRFRCFILRLAAGGAVGVFDLDVEHDDECCQIEPWATTMVLALTGDDWEAPQPDRAAAAPQREPGRPR